MSDPSHYPTTLSPSAAELQSLRSSALIVYGLFAVGLFIAGLPTIAGLILAYLKRGSAAGTIYEGHFNYAISTFWISVIVWIVGWITTFILIGWVIIGLGFVWYVYRIVSGALRAMNSRPVR